MPKDQWGRHRERFSVRVYLMVRNHLGIRNWLRNHKANTSITWTGLLKSQWISSLKLDGRIRKRRRAFSPLTLQGLWERHWSKRAIAVLVGKVLDHNGGSPNSQMVGWQQEQTEPQKPGQQRGKQHMPSNRLPWSSSATVMFQSLSRVWLLGPMDCNLPVSVYGISQARTLEWVAISFSRGSSRHRHQTLALQEDFLQTDPPDKP